MKDKKEIYREVWRKYLPLITMKLRQTVRTGQPSHIGMYRFEFHVDGRRKSQHHPVFMLDLKNGRVMNDIAKAEAATELKNIMRNDIAVDLMLSQGHFRFDLDSNFQLSIHKTG